MFFRPQVFHEKSCLRIRSMVQMSKPLVAVVTPTLNGAKYLAEAMASVQSQTWPNVVHVILDNNSTDDTPKIVDSFRGGPVPILYFRNDETLPQRPNWNKAFSLVPEDAVYVRLLCDDDAIMPESLTRMIELAETDPDIGVAGSLHICNDKTADFYWPADRQVFDGREAARNSLLGQGVIMPIHMVWRKTIADRVNPLFGDYIVGGSFDMDTVMEMLRMSKFGFVHEVLGFTRDHPGSITRSVYGAKVNSHIRDHLDVM